MSVSAIVISRVWPGTVPPRSRFQRPSFDITEEADSRIQIIYNENGYLYPYTDDTDTLHVINIIII